MLGSARQVRGTCMELGEKKCIALKIFYNYDKEDKIQRIMGIYLILSSL